MKIEECRIPSISDLAFYSKTRSLALNIFWAARKSKRPGDAFEQSEKVEAELVQANPHGWADEASDGEDGFFCA